MGMSFLSARIAQEIRQIGQISIQIIEVENG